jgi:putative endonuclease
LKEHDAGQAAKDSGDSGADPRRIRGRAGEAIARRFLEEDGCEILETNYRSRYGEIDIIVRRGSIVAFVEVKARRSRRHGEPFEAVGHRKRNQIRRMAAMWVAAGQSDQGLRACSFRFDVISILLDGKGGLREISHMKDAFR